VHFNEKCSNLGRKLVFWQNALVFCQRKQGRLCSGGGWWIGQAARLEGIVPPFPDFFWSLLFYGASAISPLSGSKYRKFAP